MRSLFFILLVLPLGVFAQQAQPGDILAQNPDANRNVMQQENVQPPETIPQGVIKVRKPQRHPYFKCEYYLTLTSVQEVEVLIPDYNIPGTYYRDKQPVFDSGYSYSNERMYPHKSVLFSRLFAEKTEFTYSFDDSTSIDTMVVEMWITRSGKLKWKRIDTAYNESMPRRLETDLYRTMMDANEWGEGGGYKTPKKFMRKQKRMGSDYYCVLYVIASSMPLTNEQRSTGSSYAPFDIPLNSPPENAQQRSFLEGNHIPYKHADPETR